MKRLLSKTLTVKQVAALFVVSLGLMSFIVAMVLPSKPATVAARKPVQKKDSVVQDTLEPADTTALGRLQEAIDSISEAPELTGGCWSFYLTTADSGHEICAYNISQGLVPASVMKVVTTGTALALLGPNHRFSTVLQYDGKIDAATKTLEGNIYIHGGGDPALGSETFGSSIDKVMNAWRDAIKRQGIDSIAGSIIGDAESGDRDPIPGGWAWEDMQNDYGIGPSALSIHENAYDIQLTAAGAGTAMRTVPQVPGMKLYNQTVHNPSVGKSYAYVQGGPYQNERVVIGEVGSYLEARSAIPDPAQFCAARLTAELKGAGIAVRDSATTMRKLKLSGTKREKIERKPIYSSMSPALSDLVFHTNQVSHNFYAESILRGIAQARAGYGSTSGGVAQVVNFWKDKGVDMRGFWMVDGSGVSRFDALTAKQLVGMLRYFAKDSAMFPVFYRSLPVAGESGTIRKLAQETEADGNLHAKSGTMSRVKSYAGYVRTKSGKLLTFAMMGNNTLWSETELRDKFERLFILMAELP